MPLATRLSRLPAAVRTAVERALVDPCACEAAIEAIEGFMQGGRTPELLIALAALTYREAESLVLSRIEAASLEALALIDEALAAGVERTVEIDALKACCLTSIARERARETNLVSRLAKGTAKTRDAVELAHRLLDRGDDDDLATALLRRAS